MLNYCLIRVFLLHYVERSHIQLVVISVLKAALKRFESL